MLGAIMYHPSFDEIKRLRNAEMAPHAVQRGRPLLPLYRDILVDLETPVSAYCKTAQGPYSFLLESVTGGERVGRYSFIGIDPYLVITHRGETATLYKMRDTVGREGIETRSASCAEGPYDSVLPVTCEEVPCYDPLQLVEAELGQYRLVAPAGVSQD